MWRNIHASNSGGDEGEGGSGEGGGEKERKFNYCFIFLTAGLNRTWLKVDSKTVCFLKTNTKNPNRCWCCFSEEAKKLKKEDMKMTVLPMHGSLPASEQVHT